jgi:hypothetical protein
MDKIPWLVPKERGIGDGDVTGMQKEGSEICIWKSRPVLEAIFSLNPSES